jgi:hypothetical protein
LFYDIGIICLRTRILGNGKIDPRKHAERIGFYPGAA